MRFIGGRSVLGESPLWDPRLDALFWVDINSQMVHRWDWATDHVTSRPTSGRPGCIALTDDVGVLLVAMEHSLLLLNWDSGAVSVQAQLPIDKPTTRLNDGRVDRFGNFWVGSMHVPASEGLMVGSLFRVRADWSVAEVATGIGVANGLAFDRARSTMYFADTTQVMVWRYELDAAGDVQNRTSFVDFRALDLPGKPDGACVDSEGGYWIACVHGGAIARVTAEGVLDRVLSVPFRRPTCVAFGGPELSTLFITSIGGGGQYPEFDDEPDAGRVAALDVGFAGVSEELFAPMRVI